jgi:hypothetical protein
LTQAAVSSAFERVSTASAPRSMQQSNSATGTLYSRARSIGRTPGATPVTSIRRACRAWSKAMPRSIRPAPPVGTTIASVVLGASGLGSSSMNAAKPRHQASAARPNSRTITATASAPRRR